MLVAVLLPVIPAYALDEEVDANPALATTDRVLDGPVQGGGSGGPENDGDPDDYDQWLVKIWISLLELRLMTLF